jgi:two-component system sensor histidine kinase YesM
VNKLIDRTVFYIRNSSMAIKIFVIFCLVSLFSLLLTGMIIYQSSSQALEEELGIYTIEIAKQVDHKLESFQDEMQRISNIIRFHSDVQEFLKFRQVTDDLKNIQAINEIRELFVSIGNLRGNLSGIFLLNDYGLMVYEAFDSVVKRSYSFDREIWYQEMKNAEGFRFWPVRPQSYVDDRPVVTFAGRLIEFDRYRDKGTLLFDFKPDIINQMSEDIRLGQTGYVFLMTEQGLPVNPNSPFPQELVAKSQFKEVLGHESGHFLIDYKGEKTLVGYYTSQSTGWKIVGIVPFEEVATGIRNVRYVLAVIVWVSVLLISLVSIWFSRMITRPLKRLENNMKEVQRGNFAVHIPIDRHDEIGRLGNRFNHMIKELNRMREEVYLSQISKYKQQLLRREAELSALQAQINPHFLYNTLNTMTCIGEVYDVEEITTVSKCLAHMFKYSISASHQAELREELDHVDAFMKIINVRFPGRFKLHTDIGDESLYDVKVVKLILQPLVENAVIHGLECKQGSGNVWIKVSRTDSELKIMIKDDGIGMSQTRLKQIRESLESIEQKTRESEGHIGLLNVKQRLYLHYGKKAALDIQSEPDIGTIVKLDLPFQVFEGGDPHV